MAFRYRKQWVCEGLRGAVDGFFRSDRLALADVFVEELVDDFLAIVEVGSLETTERIRKVEKIMPRGHAENCESTHNPKAFAARYFCCAPSSMSGISA